MHVCTCTYVVIDGHIYVGIMCEIDQKEVISALCGEMPSVENIIARKVR